MKKFLSLLAITSALAACNQETATHANNQQLTEEQINMIIDNYIEQNPEKILDSLNTHLAKLQAEEQKKMFEKKIQNPVKISLDDQTPIRGTKDAVITIVNFSDFECPFCSKVNPTLNSLMKRYEGKIRLAYMHLPLSFHKHAQNIALASIAAHKQNKFWEFHDEIFVNPTGLTTERLINIAKKLNLNIDQFKKDMNSKEAKAKLEKDIKQATSLGIAGTPAFLINGVEVSGALEEKQFVTIIEQILNSQNK